jgi:tetratricopeptide (TPR) repeat protein
MVFTINKLISDTVKIKKKGFMLNLLTIMLCMTFFLSGCVRPDYGGMAMDIELGIYDETVDTACSYFYFMWGKAAELEEKYEEAREAYEKALVCDPEAEYVSRKLAILLVNMRQTESAVALLEKMISANEDDIEVRSLLANLYTNLERYDDAVKVYQGILTLKSEDQHTMLLLGSLYARNRDYANSQVMLEKLVSINQQSFMGYSYLAKLYRELHYYDKSFAAYEKALEINWVTILAYEAAELYEYRKKFDEAVVIYLRLLEEDESNVKLRGRLSALYLEMGKTDDSLAQLRELKNYSTDIIKIDLTVGRLLMDEKRYDEAIAHFQAMIDQNSKHEMVRTFLAMAHLESGDRETAKKVLFAVTPKAKSYEDSILMLAQIYEDEDDFPEAVNILKNVIATEETRRPVFYFYLASLYRKKNDINTGRNIFEDALQQFPDNSRVWYEYGLFLEQIGKTDEALVKMEKVLVINPDDPYALNYVGYTWAERGVNLDQALEYLKKAVTAKPDDGFIRDSLGWVYYKIGDYQQGVRELKIAVSKQPHDPTINEHLGDAYLKTGDLKNAHQSYEKAVALYKDKVKKEILRLKMKELKKDN